MKTVFTNREITHIYASRSQDRGKSNSMSFSGDTFYSYAEPIGQFVDDGKSILLNRERFSVTTSAHQANLARAVSHFNVIKVGQINGRGNGFALSNKEWYESEIAGLLKKASRAVSFTNRDWYLHDARDLRYAMTEYVRIFKLDWTIPVIPEDLTEIKAAAQKKAREESAATKARKAEEAKRYAENAALWLKGEPIYLADHLANRPTLLRVKGDEVETSRGARFPVAHAVRGLALVRSVRERGTEWQANGHTCHLGPYRINRITPQGTVYAGCHVVPWSSIEAIVPQIEALSQKEVA